MLGMTADSVRSIRVRRWLIRGWAVGRGEGQLGTDTSESDRPTAVIRHLKVLDEKRTATNLGTLEKSGCEVTVQSGMDSFHGSEEEPSGSPRHMVLSAIRTRGNRYGHEI